MQCPHIMFILIIWGIMKLYTFRQNFQFTLLQKLHQLIFSETAWWWNEYELLCACISINARLNKDGEERGSL